MILDIFSVLFPERTLRQRFVCREYIKAKLPGKPCKRGGEQEREGEEWKQEYNGSWHSVVWIRGGALGYKLHTAIGAAISKPAGFWYSGTNQSLGGWGRSGDRKSQELLFSSLLAKQLQIWVGHQQCPPRQYYPLCHCEKDWALSPPYRFCSTGPY